MNAVGSLLALIGIPLSFLLLPASAQSPSSTSPPQSFREWCLQKTTFTADIQQAIVTSAL